MVKFIPALRMAGRADQVCPNWTSYENDIKIGSF
jgi:hypothetical protein